MPFLSPPMRTYSTFLRYATIALAVCARAAVAADKNRHKSGTAWATPHDSFSSSVGVLGCKIDTNRVAYWPDSVDCNNICVSLSYGDRELKLLRIDQSEGAHDISYDAWNYLYTGESATEKPVAGGPLEMQYEYVDASECAHLIHTKGSQLPFSAANSMNFIASCIDQKDSWVGSNYVLYNIIDSICTMGFNEKCKLDYPALNQPACPNTLGDQSPLKSQPVYNILYPSGKKHLASDPIPPPTPGDVITGGGDEEDAAPQQLRPLGMASIAVAISAVLLALQ